MTRTGMESGIRTTTRGLLTPLELVYAAAVRLRNRHYDRAAQRRLDFPVISIGNLSIGGSGKTPLTICLARLLEREGFSPDVLSRGYGRSGGAVKRVEHVDPEGEAERFGDEPLLIARVTKVPVFVGASRYEAGLLAEREIPPGPRRLHLLDDGFQHRELARAVNIVAIHRSDLDGRLLPSGRLREPLTSLRRADVIVLREEDAPLAAKLAPYVRKGTHFWSVRRSFSLSESKKRAIAFCGVARPDEFFQVLETAGVELAAKLKYRDHHRYSEKDIEALSKLGARLHCQEFVTTGKDAVNLNAELREKLARIAPLRVVELRVEIADEAVALRQLTEALRNFT